MGPGAVVAASFFGSKYHLLVVLYAGWVEVLAFELRQLCRWSISGLSVDWQLVRQMLLSHFFRDRIHVFRSAPRTRYLVVCHEVELSLFSEI